MDQPQLDLLTRRAFPELAAALRGGAARILEQWEAAVRDALPTADELTLAQLRDSFPRVLATMADALTTERGEAVVDGMLAFSVEHGETRFHQDYKLDEVLIEYHLLRRVVFEQVGRHLGRPLALEETLALNLGFDATTREAAVAFSRHQTRQVLAANEAQSKYLSFLSHDLRGGLNGIFLMIEVLRRELVNHPQLGETAEDLDLMRRSLLETVGTMDRFLHAERFRKGKVQVRPGPVNLNHVLQEASAQFAYQAKDKGLDLRVNVESPVARIVSDRELLMLIVQNLVSNAVKYTGKGSVQIGARPIKGGWQVEVADEGPGIAPDKLAELFDSFTRGETHGQPGTGLGLSIARQAADLLGAKLWAESEPGAGSRFYVQLPEVVGEAK